MVRSRTNTGNSGFGKNAGLPSGRMSRVQKRRGICGCGVKSSTSQILMRARLALFREIDTDNDGFISVNEFVAAIRHSPGLSPPLTTDTLVEVFTDEMFAEDKKLSFDDFVTLMNDSDPVYHQGLWYFKPILKYGFKKIDTNNSDSINITEFSAALNSFGYLSNIPAHLHAGTVNSSFLQLFGKMENESISLDEFVAAALPSNVTQPTMVLYLAINAISRSAALAALAQ